MRILLALCGCLVSTWCFANIDIEQIRVSSSEEKTRVVFDWSAPAPFQVFNLSEPDRIVLDIKDAELKSALPEQMGAWVHDVRTAQKIDNNLRIVFDTAPGVQAKYFQLEASGLRGQRLIIDLYKPDPYPLKDKPLLVSRPFIIAIDAGHGGKDPGSIGRHFNTQEKDVALAMAKKLAAKIDKTPNRHALLVRENDETLSLRERTARARQKGADLFISIHADSFPDERVEGASVYVLSEKGATSEAARWLAERENDNYELLGGIELDDKSDMLASVLLDLSQNATKTASHELANIVLSNLKSVVPLHKNYVESAGFGVLKSPDLPSILVETGFISSKVGEKRLTSTKQQQKIANAIYKGIESFLNGRTLPYVQAESAWILNELRHIVVYGDTLSEIAEHYNISLKALKAKNQLKSNSIRVGQVLKIPN